MMPEVTDTPAPDVAGLVVRMAETCGLWADDEPREDWWSYQQDHDEARLALTTLSARIAALEGALREIADHAASGRQMIEIARAALSETSK